MRIHDDYTGKRWKYRLTISSRGALGGRGRDGSRGVEKLPVDSSVYKGDIVQVFWILVRTLIIYRINTVLLHGPQ